LGGDFLANGFQVGCSMSDAVAAYENLIEQFGSHEFVFAGQMFGKPCLKINGKAFIAQQHEAVIFKLNGQPHAAALSLPGSKLWDPSGKGRPMKEWVEVSAVEELRFGSFADAAIAYVRA
jgi:hypothetical protein